MTVVLVSMVSYAIKTQLKAPKAPYMGNFLPFAVSLGHKRPITYDRLFLGTSVLNYIIKTQQKLSNTSRTLGYFELSCVFVA